ncbi:MAG: hypothetical protein HY738_20790, partial [Bacteroidia bacterium]|nr:hypothetical protein [Bacteroidia bacterium]
MTNTNHNLFFVLTLGLGALNLGLGACFAQDTLQPPMVILTDTCPKPYTFTIPVTGEKQYTIQTAKGPRTITIEPPKTNPLPIVTTPLPSGGVGGGLDQSAAGRGFFTTYTTDDGLALDAIAYGKSIFCDSKGNLWFGTAGGGASRYDGKSFTNFTSAQGLANNIVMCITEDNSGNLWFGTYGGGASRYDGNCEAIANTNKNKQSVSKSFTNFTTAQGLANNYVSCITADKSGNLWFGTDGGIILLLHEYIQDWHVETQGPASLQPKKIFLNITKKDGLSDDVVMSIKEDKEGNIFIGTNFGITVLSKGFTFGKGETFTGKIEIYNSSTGYPVKDVNGGSGNGAMLIDSKGILWAGTGAEKTALVRMDYNAIHRNDKPPVVIIQNLKVNNENICWYNLIRPKSQTQSSKFQGTDSLSVAPTFRSGVNKDSLNSQGFSPLTKEDSLAIILEE